MNKSFYCSIFLPDFGVVKILEIGHSNRCVVSFSFAIASGYVAPHWPPLSLSICVTHTQTHTQFWESNPAHASQILGKPSTTEMSYALGPGASSQMLL